MTMSFAADNLIVAPKPKLRAGAGRLGHGAPRPVDCLAGRLGQSQGDDPLAHLGSERRYTGRAGLVLSLLSCAARAALQPMMKTKEFGRIMSTIILQEHCAFLSFQQHH